MIPTTKEAKTNKAEYTIVLSVTNKTFRIFNN